MSAVELVGLTKRYGDVIAVNDVSLEIGDGEFISFLGPSGCGKSTLLSIVAGLDEPSAGSILFDGKDVTGHLPKERGIAMVFQDYALYPHMTVHQNLEFPLKALKMPQDKVCHIISDVAENLNIVDLLQRRPSELSGGQRQRVALGRALVRNPTAFLMDEPLSNLDAKLRVQMRAELKRLKQNLSVTTIYVTHDQTEAMTLSDKVAIFNAGVLQQVDTPPNIYNRPANVFVASFVGASTMNFLEGEIVAAGNVPQFHGVDLRFTLPACLDMNRAEHGGRSVLLGLRAEELSMKIVASEAGSGTAMQVEMCEYLGHESYVHLRRGDTKLVVRTSPMQIPTGQWHEIVLKDEPPHLFDPVSGLRI